MNIYQYSAGDHPDYHKPDNRWEFPEDQPTYGEQWDLVVTDLAKDYYDNHDGWEDSWPVEFRVHKDGETVARHLVYLEHEPAFYEEELDLEPRDAA